MEDKQFRAAVISLGSKSSKITAEAMRKYFAQVDELQIKDVEIVLGQQDPILYQGNPIGKYDCVYVKGSHRYAAIAQTLSRYFAKNAYVPVRPSSFSVVHDKLLTHIELQDHSIPMPRTYISSTPQAAKELLKNLNYPIIMKFPQGTHGKGVMFADSYNSASSLLDALDSINQSFIIQEYMETGGVDVRAFVVGGRVIGAMKRKSSGEEKRSNIHAGGAAENYIMPVAARKIAVNTAKAIGADVCGVDMLETVKGFVVIEANLSPGLQGITQATGLDIADSIARHFYQKTQEMQSSAGNFQAQSLLEDTEKVDEEIRTIFGPLDFRGDRVLLSEMIVKRTEFEEDQDYTITFQKGKLEITKGM